MKIADCHMHSFFSSDSEAPTEEMVKRAVELGLPAICLTDHYDMDYSTGEFQLDTPAYAAKIRELQEQIESISKTIAEWDAAITQLQERMDRLQAEYQEIPDFSEIQIALSEKRELERILETLENEYLKQQAQEHRLSEQKNRQYQEVLKLCKMLPYGRTAEAYEEACGAAEEYGRIWQSIRRELLHMQTEQISCLDKKERIDQYNDDLEEAYTEKRTYSTRAKACEIQIRQLEEYLRSPELLEKANRLKQVKEEFLM